LRAKHILAALALVGIACASGVAQAADALEQFKSFVAGSKSARGEFVQRVARLEGGASLKVSKESSGTFQFSRPGRFIWTYKKPYEQVLQADGEKLYIYDRDLNQVTVRKLGNALGSSPAAILFGSNDIEKNFTLKEGAARDGMNWLEAVPKAKDTTFEKIGIAMKDGVPAAMELRDSFGQVTLLSFRKFEKNPALPDTQYRFVPPKGADVLEQ
jgi:outer membrane lipoprotein carrier protein